ncbi:MAG: tetratricopeptide repeat protein [Cyclobacteriaceae bacterium]
MKKILAIFLSLMIVGFVNAQKPPKGSPSKAESYLAKDDLSNAKAEIDMAITIEKTASKANTWLTRAKVYQAIAIAGDDEAIPVAMEAYGKYKEMNPGGAQLVEIQNIPAFHGSFFNRAGEAYNQALTLADEGKEAEAQGQFTESMEYFQKALKVMPTDTSAMMFGASAAYQAGDNDATLGFYRRIIDMGGAQEDIYNNAIYLARNEMEDIDTALELIGQAKEAFPENTQYRKDEIQIYLDQGREKEALEKLETAVAKDPDDGALHLQLGMFKDNLAYNLTLDDKWEEAREMYGETQGHYEKVLALNPDDFVANFNLGAMYVNLSKEYYDKVNDMDIATYNKEGKEVLAKGNDVIKKSIPLLKKATELNPEDVETWKALQRIYTRLKMNKEAEDAFNKVEELGG